MIKKGYAIAALAALPFLGTFYSKPSYSQDAPAKKAAARPHYLEDVTYYRNEVDQIIEESRVMDSYSTRFGRSTFTNGNIAVVTTVNNTGLTLIFHNYEDKGDHVRYNDGTGFKRLSKDEFARVQDDLIACVTSASREAYADHAQITSRIVTIQEAHLKKNKRLKPTEKLEDLLNRHIPNDDTLTYADVLHVPILKVEDFVPRVLHFGPLRAGVLGVTYLNSGEVGYHPLARQLDYVNGGPNILKHELVHRCEKLQGVPLVYEFDAEFHASMVERDNSWWYLRHSYLEDERSLAKVLFGFDAERAMKEVKPLTLMMGSTLNREKLEGYVKDIQDIRKTVRETYLNDFLPEFYTHLTFWTAVNKDMNDTNAAFKIYMHSKFEPTLLQGAKNTRKWLQQNKQIIEEASRRALENVKKDIGDDHGMEGFFEKLPKEEKDAIKSYLRTLGVKENEDVRPALRVLQKLYDKGVFDSERDRR